MKKLLFIFTFTALLFSGKVHGIGYISKAKKVVEITEKHKNKADSLINAENSLKIIIGKTDRKTIEDYLGKPNDEFGMIACGTATTAVTKKILFWKRTKTYTSGGTSRSVSRLAYKKYGICIEFSSVKSGEDEGASKATDIEIFDNRNLEGKRTAQNTWYYDGDFQTLEQETMLKIFGKTFVKHEDEETESYDYTFSDKILNFVFSKKDNKLVSLEVDKCF